MKRLIIGIILLVMLGGIAAIMQYNKSSSTVRSELTNFTFEDTASIQRITLKSQSGELVELRRKKNNNWQSERGAKGKTRCS